MCAAATAPRGGNRLLVVLCADLSDTASLPQPHRLALAIRDRDDVAVANPGRVCVEPSLLVSCEAASAVVVVCRAGHEHRQELISWLHQAGLRFDSVDVVAAPSTPAAARTDATAALLRAVHAAIAGLGAEPYPMLSAERPAAGVRHTSRRSPLAAASSRLPMPTLSRAGCRASTGCDICVTCCPVGAVTMTADGPEIDATRCTGCGACVAECPTDAWRLAGSSDHQLTARLAALLGPAGLPAADGIDFRCARARTGPAEVPEWAELVVPSLLAIGTGAILQALVNGAGAVHLTSCEDAECGHAAERLTHIANAVLRAASRPVAVTCTPAPAPRRPRGPAHRPGTVHAGIRDPSATLAAIQVMTEAAALCVASPVAPLGTLRVDAATCTACEACVTACPTSALRASSNGDWVLSYHPHGCVGCGICSRTCPEAAITVERVIDTDALASDSVALCRGQIQPCVTCGRPVSDLPVRRAAAARLAAAAPAVASVTATTCGRCGPANLGADLPSSPADPAMSRTGPR